MATKPKKRKANRVMGIAVGPDRDWQAESDLDTLMRAREIEKDKKRYARAQAVAKERLMNLASVATDDEASE